jgi:hypothetical protein
VTAVLYKDMTASQLRAEYWAERNGLAGVADLACAVTTARGRKTAARLTGAKLRRFDLIVNVARSRGIDLLADDDPA